MKFYRLIFIVLMTSLFLCSCGPIYQMTYSYQPPKSSSGKMCTAQCFQTKNRCQQMCRMQDQNCRMTAHQQAYYRYQQYSDHQKSLGKPVKRSVNDFDNSYNECNSACHCTPDFNACYQSCGGIVSQHKECTAFCN